MKPIIKRLSCVLLVVLWLPPEQVKLWQLIGDVHLPETIIIGSNNTIVRE